MVFKDSWRKSLNHEIQTNNLKNRFKITKSDNPR